MRLIHVRFLVPYISDFAVNPRSSSNSPFLGLPGAIFIARDRHKGLRLWLGCICAVMAASFPGTPLFAQGPTVISQPVLSLDLARGIADAALERCRAEGYHPSITVIDASGLIKVQLRDDGNSPHTVDVSRRKAFTALIYRRPSTETVKNWATAAPVPLIEGTIAIGGGLPIKFGTETIGAIGVSGAPGAPKDEMCATAGIAKFAAQLKPGESRPSSR